MASPAAGTASSILRLSSGSLDEFAKEPARKKMRIKSENLLSPEIVVPEQPRVQTSLLTRRLTTLEKEAIQFATKLAQIKEEIEGTAALFLKMMIDREMPEAFEAPPTQEFDDQDMMDESVSLEDLIPRIDRVADEFRQMMKTIKHFQCEIRLEANKRTLATSLIDGSGSSSLGARGSQEPPDLKLEDRLNLMESRRGEIDEKINALSARIKFWRSDQWENRTFNDEEVELLLASSLRFAEDQQTNEKEKIGLSDFTIPSVPMECKVVGSAVAVFSESVQKPDKPGNQDCFLMKMLPQFSCFIVCDGHGPQGGDVAESLCQELPKLLENFIKDGFSKTALFNLLRSDFRQLDQLLLEFEQSGSTLTCVMQTSLGLMFAIVGDSRVVLDIEGKAYQCTADQTTKEPFLVQLVKMRGVEVKKVPPGKNGVLRVMPARARVTSDMGNHGYKTGHLKDLSCIPEITMIEYDKIKRGNSFLLIASDGFWDLVNSDQAVAILRERLKFTSDLKIIAKEILAACINKQGGKLADDTTLIIVPL